MKSVLYLLTKSNQSWPDYQFILEPNNTVLTKTAVVLNHEGKKKNCLADTIFELKDEEKTSSSTKENDSQSDSLSKISYRDLLNLIFSSDHVIVV